MLVDEHTVLLVVLLSHLLDVEHVGEEGREKEKKLSM